MKSVKKIARNCIIVLGVFYNCIILLLIVSPFLLQSGIIPDSSIDAEGWAFDFAIISYLSFFSILFCAILLRVLHVKQKVKIFYIVMLIISAIFDFLYVSIAVFDLVFH